MSYRFVDSFWAGPGWNSVPSWSCSTAVYKPVWHMPLLSVQWINSWWCTDELSETCRVSWQNKFVKLVHLVGFITKKFVTMQHGHWSTFLLVCTETNTTITPTWSSPWHAVPIFPLTLLSGRLETYALVDCNWWICHEWHYIYTHTHMPLPPPALQPPPPCTPWQFWFTFLQLLIALVYSSSDVLRGQGTVNIVFVAYLLYSPSEMYLSLAVVAFCPTFRSVLIVSHSL